MASKKSDPISVDQEKQFEQELETKAAHKLTKWILSIIGVLVVVVGIFGTLYVHDALQPFNTSDKSELKVKIPIGSTNKDIAVILEKNKIIKNATIFNYWTKTKSLTDFRAGDFYLSPSMSLDEVVHQLQTGGTRTVVARVLVREGVTVEEVGDAIAKNTKFKKADFLKLMKNDTFIKSLAKKYPKLLDSSLKSKSVRYNLEGYLFPAKYDVYKSTTLKELVTQMVQKANEVYTPYFAKIKAKDLTVQEALTLSSLIEREGVTKADRAKISGVFFNRLAIDMPLQSDIAVMYALNTHKKSLSLEDIKVKSPYNLYVHAGFGPGPFNNPSLESLNAVLNPVDQDQGYLYFVANLDTGKVYYSTTYDEHLNTNADLGQ